MCRGCSGIKVPVDCRRCGTEDDLYRSGTCWRCALDEDVTSLLTAADGEVPTKLRPLARSLIEMPRANSGITWLRNAKVRALLAGLACGDIELTHVALDALPRSRTVEYVRELLGKCEAIEVRDRHLATYQRWLDERLATIEDADQRRLVETFGRWHHVRRLREQARLGPVETGSFLVAKQSTTLAIDFLAWLALRGRSLAELTQRDVDAWFAAGPATRRNALAFLYWALRTRRTRNVRLPSAQPKTHPAIGAPERLVALRTVLTDDAIKLPWRVAGALVLLFGQPAVRIARLRLDQVRFEEACSTTVRLAQDWLEVPEPVATILSLHASRRPNTATAANVDAQWLFPGLMPGQPICANRLVTELRAIDVPVLASRSGTWQQLVREGPPSVLANALGISPMTAMKHAERAGADWLRYAALRGSAPASSSF